MKKRDCTIRVAKTKALIIFAVTVKLICLFVFVYAKSWFSHDAAQIIIATYYYTAHSCKTANKGFAKVFYISNSIRGAIQKFVDKCIEINNNHWIRLKIY